MVKVEDIQNYGKEHLESVAASASNMQSGVQAIASAYGDFAKKSFEDTKSFVEKLSGVKSVDAPDARTVVFHLKAPDATFPFKLATPAAIKQVRPD